MLRPATAHTSSRRTAAVAALAVLTAVLTLPAAPGRAAAADVPGTRRIDFQPASAPVPAGYTPDSGQGYDDARGFGWVAPASGAPVDLTGNARDRGAPADRRLATLMHMQLPANAATSTGSGRWELAVPAGTYAVTVAVGDGGRTGSGYCCLDSIHRLVVEGVLAADGFVPTPAAPFATNTVTVAVSDGRLTLDPVGGTNTKIDYVDVVPSTDAPQQPSPLVTGVTPPTGATKVALDTSINLDVSEPLDRTTVDDTTFVLTGPAGPVTGNYNTDAVGGTAAFTPSANLQPNSTYTVTTTGGLRAASGRPFGSFRSTFTTGTAPPPLSPYAFTRTATTTVAKPGVMVLGPDGRLYVGTASGLLLRYPRRADGSLGPPESSAAFSGRIVLGLAFDPADPTSLWVTNNDTAYSNAPRFSGRLSTLTLTAGAPFSAAAATLVDRVVGLPRSAHDHMTNGIAFGPDGRLYVAQGANTAYGATDSYWGTRGESPLSAAVLALDVRSGAGGGPLDVNTDPVGTAEDPGSAPAAGYDPGAAGAPLTVFASGVRNPFSLAWAGNGRLYAPVNESAAGGNTPVGPGGVPPALVNVQAYDDYFTRIDPGAYYGHPNPSIGHTTLNGGNPTAGADPDEVTEYPVGVLPDPAWRQPDLSLGDHRSPDGVVQYASGTAFGGALAGAMLISEYSSGDDVVVVGLDGAGRAVTEAALPDAAHPGQALHFDNPLGIASDPASGVVYVAQYGDETDPSSGSIAVLTPGLVLPPPAVTGAVHINFQPGAAPVPDGWTADAGAPFGGSSGWQDLAGAPLDLRANTRDRNSSLAPDQRYDTFIHMQAYPGSGVTTPGRWLYALPSGQYDVRVVVGEPTAVNSVHTINAESGTPNAVTIVDRFVPTSAALFGDVTRRVTVQDGFLTLDPVGGTNTKLAFVEITPVVTPPAGPGVLKVAGPDDAALGAATPRLVFSTSSGRATPARPVTVTNTGTGPMQVALAVQGAGAASFRLDPAQPATVTVAAGQSVQVPVLFTPTAATGCPTAASPNPVSDIERYATLAVTTDAAAPATATVDLAGLNACGVEGGNEPILGQLVRALGYTTKVQTGSADVRFLGPARTSTSDEVQAPYFTRVDTGAPVTLTPVAHYSGRTVTTGTFGGTGWYDESAAFATPCGTAVCRRLFGFPGDAAAPGPYAQNQMLLPAPSGTTSFTPAGAFGLWNGDGQGINAADDAKNVALTDKGVTIAPPHYLHDLRVYPAYGPNRVRIPGTWIVAVDITRVPSYKNNDYQDVVLVLRNAAVETPTAVQPGGTGTTLDLSRGGTISSTCAVTGFTGVLPNTGGTQCDPSRIAFRSGGLALTSSPGQLGGSTNNQQNALYSAFDASRTPFTVSTRVVGPIGPLTTNYQQVAAFLGPDQDNYVKVEAEHNGAGTDPHLTMYVEEGGVGRTAQSVSVPGLTSASTLDLVVQGNSSVPDPLAPADDPNGVRRYPLGELTVSYSLDGAAPVRLGPAFRPADVLRWFSTSARAGILVSGGGATAPITATFRSFSIRAG